MIEAVLLALVTAFVLITAFLWVVRILAEEAWAAFRGKPSPRIERRRAREQLARECGTPTIGQAISFRIANRVANPPERRLLAKVRAYLVEVVEDGLTEAQVRHQHAHEARVRARRARQAARRPPPRGQGWQARTGGHQPPPHEEETVATATRPCRECLRVFVVEPEELCTACERTAAEPPPAPPPPDPYPDPDDLDDLDDLDDDQIINEQEPITMTAATHTINGDVRDPRTALSFAESCRGFNNAVVRELDILANNMANAGLGPNPIAEIRVLGDAARTYSGSNRRSVRKYAEHVLTQEEIRYDDDLRDTVRRTYLDTQGSDLALPASGGSVRAAFSAADAHDPSAGMRFMEQVAAAYWALKTSVDQTKGNHQRQGVTGVPIVFLNEQLELATIIYDKAAAAARTFARHVRKREDTVGKDPSLHNTQRGRYLDPAKA